jgi:hypothetical protein
MNHGAIEASRLPLTSYTYGNSATGHPMTSKVVGWLVIYTCGCTEYRWA